MLSLQKKKLFSLFSLLNLSFKKIHKHTACKLNRYEQGGAGRKFEVWVKILFEWPQSLFAPTKI